MLQGVGFETLYPEFLTIQYGGVKCSVKSVMKTRIECTAEVMASAMESQLQVRSKERTVRDTHKHIIVNLLYIYSAMEGHSPKTIRFEK